MVLCYSVRQVGTVGGSGIQHHPDQFAFYTLSSTLSSPGAIPLLCPRVANGICIEVPGYAAGVFICVIEQFGILFELQKHTWMGEEEMTERPVWLVILEVMSNKTELSLPEIVVFGVRRIALINNGTTEFGRIKQFSMYPP